MVKPIKNVVAVTEGLTKKQALAEAKKQAKQFPTQRVSVISPSGKMVKDIIPAKSNLSYEDITKGVMD